MIRLCAVCEVNQTERLMDGGWGEKRPVCTDCLTSGAYKKLIPAAKTAKAKASADGQGDYQCPECNVVHRAGSKIHKRHLKLLAK